MNEHELHSTSIMNNLEVYGKFSEFVTLGELGKLRFLKEN